MQYLIDGHNLIAKMPDISLDDPNDEMKLILRLKSWAAAGRKRRVTVIFDGGLPGGKSVRYSNRSVNVIFASEGRTADSLLINRIRKAKNPPEYTLISSDHQIINAAKARRMGYRRSEEFSLELGEAKGAAKRSPPKSPEPDVDEKPQISEQEVAEWIELFGPVPERAPKQAKRRQIQRREEDPGKEEKPARKRPLAVDKGGDRALSDDEVDDWIKLFKSGKS